MQRSTHARGTSREGPTSSLTRKPPDSQLTKAECRVARKNEWHSLPLTVHSIPTGPDGQGAPTLRSHDHFLGFRVARVARVAHGLTREDT